MKTLAAFIPVDRLQELAHEEARLVSSRWDVPSDPSVPADLRDTAGRFFAMPDGSSVASRMAPTDLTTGSASPVVPLLIAALPVLVALGSAFPKFAPVLILAAAVLIFILSVALGAERNRWVFGLAVALPLVAPFITKAVNAASGAMGGGLGGSGLTMLAAPLGLVLGVVWLFSKDGHGKENLKHALQALAGFVVVSMVARSVLPQAAQSAPWFALACATPWLYTKALAKKRAEVLLEQASVSTASTTGRNQLAHVQARKIQAANASKDLSGEIRLGTATGTFSKRWDGFAPDEGLPFIVSPNDLAQHLAIFGSTGTGKTSRALRPVMRDWLKHKAGGVLILDGKGSLPAEIASNVDGALLIVPGVPLGLLDGLDATDVVLALVPSSAGAKSENGEFFRVSAQDQLRHGAVLLAGIIAAERDLVGAGLHEGRKWLWTVSELSQLITALQASAGISEDGNPEQFRKQMLAFIRLNAPDALAGGLLTDALGYWEKVAPQFDERVAGSIYATVQSWLSPLMSHPELLAWSKSETGVDPTLCLRGGVVGVSLPAFRFGAAGAMVQSLVKQRIFRAIRRRADNPKWKEQAETQVLFVVDEAQELVNQADLDLLPIGRSLGARFCYATQSFENYVAKFGAVQAKAFIDCFQSVVSFSASHGTYEMLSQVLGNAEQMAWSKPTAGLNFVQTAKSQAGSALWNASHPDAEHYRALRLKGIGGFRPVSRSSSWKQIAHDSAHGSLAEVDPRSLKRSNLVYDAAVEPTTSAGWKVGPLLTLEDWEAHLSTPGCAIATVMRGGVKRRDFITTVCLDERFQEVAGT